MSEHQVQSAIIEYCKRQGYIVNRSNAGLAFSPSGGRMVQAEPGFPDLTIFTPDGRTVLIEVKSAKGQVSPTQAQMHARLAQLGHQVIVARSVEDVARILI